MNHRSRPEQAGVYDDNRAGGDNLPTQVTSFVGREQEIAEVQRLLDTTHILTLTGSPGVGKSRLALRAASELPGDYSDGVWLVELASLHHPTLVPRAVATAVGVLEETRRPLAETLARLLGPRALLLVLDNCEHLVDACAELADHLLRACPRLRILATSREALGIAGEVTWRVPSLSVPDPGRKPPLPELAEFDASRLFVDRAAAAWPGFRLTAQNGPAIAQICHQLDGIPLAIELAAARIKALAPEQIAARLDQRFRLLTGGNRTSLPRHRTLRALVDWSHELLSPPEQVLLRRLAVFAGGWTLDAAEAVCAPAAGAGGPSRLPSRGAHRGRSHLAEPESAGNRSRFGTEDILNLLASLLDKSLVLADEQGGEKRYRLLETVRQYAQERLLEAGETENFRDRHLDWSLRLAQRAEPELGGPEQTHWFDRLDVEHDNLRAALAWSQTDATNAERGLQLAGALWWFWILRGHVGEGREHLERLLGLVHDPTPTRARALHAAGLIAYTRGDYEQARALTEAGLALWQRLGGRPGIGAALAQLGRVAQGLGDPRRAEQLLLESRALFAELGGESGLDSPVARYQAELAYSRGDQQQAQLRYEEALGQSRQRGDRHGVANGLRGLAHLTRLRGDNEHAKALFEEALALLWELKDQRCSAQCLGGLARAAAPLSGPERTVCQFSAAESLRQTLGTPLTPAERAGYEQDLAAVRARLPEAAFAAAWAQGQTMTLAQAIEAALTPDEPAPAALDEPGGATGQPQAPVLTAREQEVVERIARGYTNRQIATELVISERTVHAHVRNILDKLGFGSRAQVAAWAAQAGRLTT